MTIFLAMICISVGFVANAQAQSIIISVDGINQEADTLNFGARTENNPKVDSFFVVNNTNDTLLIPYDPKYLNRVNAIPFDNTFAEFELDTIQQRSRPFIILPGTRFPVKINFKVDTADKGAGFESDGLLKRGRIFINLCKYGDTNDIKASDTIHLIGDRTVRFMKPSDSVIVFDTMYIGTTKKDTLIVYNGTSSKTLDINITTKNISNVKINPTDIGAKLIPPDSSFRIPIEYTVNSLSDSLISDVLTITSSPGAKSSEETSSIDLKTFVAFQKFEIDSNRTMSFDPSYGRKLIISNGNRIDVVDTIAIDSLSETFSVILANNGNIPLNIDRIAVSGDTNGFQFDFSTLNRNLNPTRPTLFTFSFKPVVQSGQWSANIALYTDLRKRFPNLPIQDSIEVVRLFIHGIAKAGLAYLESDDNNCDTIYVSPNANSGCNPACSTKIIINNTEGETELKVSTIQFENTDSKFNVQPQKITIPKGEKKVVDVLLNPGNKAGTFSNNLIVYFDSREPLTIPISFISIPTYATVSFDTVIVSPGEEFSIPINVNSQQLSKAQYIVSRLFIPCKSREAIEFVNWDLGNSAAERATPILSKSYNLRVGSTNQCDEILSFDQSLTGSFEDFNSTYNTLGKLRFKYFLNEDTVSEIFVEKFNIGRGTYVSKDSNNIDVTFLCDDFFNVTYPPKIIIKAKENSFCADQETLNSLFKDIRDTNDCKFLALIPVSGSVLEIQHFMPKPMHADISLYAVTGEKVETIFSGIAPKDLTKFQHPLSHLTKGVYYCEMKTGTFRKTIPIIISQ